MYDFSNSHIHNTGGDINSWNTKCIAVTDDNQLGQFALSAECINEEVPFAIPKNRREAIIFKRHHNYKFYTITNGGLWYKHGNLSCPESIYFYESETNDQEHARKSFNSAIFNLSNIQVRDVFAPIIFEESQSLYELNYSQSIFLPEWYQNRDSLINRP